MLTEQPAHLQSTQLLDALPDAVYWMRALRDTDGQVVDFQVDYVNQKAQAMTQGVYQAGIGTTVLGTNQHDRPAMEWSFRELCDVLATGQVRERTFYNPALDNWFLANRTKLGDGVLSVIRNVTAPKAAEQRSEQQAQLLSGILEASLNGIITYESMRDESGTLVDFRFVRFNNAAKQMLSLKDEMIGEPMLNELPGTKEAGLFDKFVTVVETGKPARFETTLPAGHQLLWYDMSVVKLGDGFVVTFNDITRTKRAALEDERQRTLLDGILNASREAIFVLEALRDQNGVITDFRYTHANRMATERFGHSADQLLQATFLTLYPGTEEVGLFAHYCRVIETGDPYHDEVFYDRDGLRTWFDVSAVKLGDGLALTVADIDDRKRVALRLEQQAEENRRQSELMQTMLDGALNGVLLLEPIRDSAQDVVTDFRILAANRAVEPLTGANPAEIIGRTMQDVYPNYKQGGFFGFYCDVLESGQLQQRGYYYEDDTLSGWFDVSGVKQGNEIVVTFVNTTEAKRAQLANEQAANENKRQANLLNSVLNSSPSGIKALEAVRNEAGEIIDFTVTVINRAGAAVRGKAVNEMIGQRLLRAFPGIREAGLYDQHVRVVQTGEAQQIQSFYGNAWYNMTLSPFDDGVVVTYTDVSESRRAQQALAQAAADLQAVIDSSQTGIFVFSPVYDEAGQHVDFRFKTINRMVAALVGQTPDVLAGAVASDWFTSYRETGLFDHYKRTFDTGEPQRFDIHYDVDGFDVWFDVHSVKFGADVLVTFTNYTDLKQAQLAVERQATETKKQAELLDSILNSSNNGIMSFEAVRDDGGAIVDFRIITVNQASAQLTGTPVGTLRNSNLLTLFPGNVDSGLFAMYVKTTETGEPTQTETYYQYDGLDFWLSISAQKLGDGFVVTFSDVSLIKRAAQVVAQSAIQLQTVIDTAQTGIFLFSPVRDETGEVIDFRFRLANRQLAAYVGQQPEAVTGALGSTWFPNYKSNGLFDAYRTTYVTGEPQRFDFHYDADGIDVWLDILSTKMGDEVVVTFGDYTPLKKLQQQLEASVADLQHSNKNLEQFAYVASHDLQEPLRKIQAFGSIVQAQYAPLIGPEGADMIQRMQSAAARMQVLIRDVLAYSRVATKREATAPVDLNQLIDGVLSDLERAIEDKRAVVTINALPTINGDAPQLRQLFQNLIGNALKFNKPGEPASITVSSRLVRGGDLSNVLVSPADVNQLFCQIEVADNGIGFEPHHAERIFQVFQRLHGRSHYEGTGIGLAIVQKVVQNHQGYITAEGRPGNGATFQVTLPV